jgi:8-oxo-dGTP pyrophosphatase MutT (NUDIX family)
MTPRPGDSLQAAAVLVPLFRGPGADRRVLLVRRTDAGVHGGQIAFPGGKRDPRDRSFAETAVRETQEEVGLDPSRVDVLARLPVVRTLSTGFRIYPYLARVRPSSPWRANPREVAEILEVRIDDLLDPAGYGEEDWQLPGWPAPRRVRFFRIGEGKLWGATYRILHPLLPRIASGEWEF